MVETSIHLDLHATTHVSTLECLKKWGHILWKSLEMLLDHTVRHDGSVTVNKSHKKITNTIGAHLNEIIFTSGATESDNLVLRSVIGKLEDKPHIITCATEHKAILNTARDMKGQECKVMHLPVGEFSMANPKNVADVIMPDTKLIFIMFANN